MSNTPGEQPPYGQENAPGQIPAGPGAGGQPAPGAAGYGAPQYGQAPYSEPQYGQAQYGQPQYGQAQFGQPGYPAGAAGFGGYAGADPALVKRASAARTSGILSIVFGGIAFFILGFLSIPGLVLGIQALTSASKVQAAGLPAGPARTLGIIGVVVSSISLVGWAILTLTHASLL